MTIQKSVCVAKAAMLTCVFVVCSQSYSIDFPQSKINHVHEHFNNPTLKYDI